MQYWAWCLNGSLPFYVEFSIETVKDPIQSHVQFTVGWDSTHETCFLFIAVESAPSHVMVNMHHLCNTEEHDYFRDNVGVLTFTDGSKAYNFDQSIKKSQYQKPLPMRTLQYC